MGIFDDIWKKTGGQLFGDAQHDDSQYTESQYNDDRWALGGDAGYADQQAGYFNNQAAQMGNRGTGTGIDDVDGPDYSAPQQRARQSSLDMGPRTPVRPQAQAPLTQAGVAGMAPGLGQLQAGLALAQQTAAGPAAPSKFRKPADPMGGMGRVSMGNGNVGAFSSGSGGFSNAAAGGTPKAKTNYLGNEMDSRGEQMYGLGQMRQNLQMARDAAMGKAPSVAEEQLRYGNDLNNASIQSQAASARGPGGLAMAQMNAQAQMANGNQSTNANQAILRAQEMANARAQLYGVTDSYGQQASGLRGLDQSIINSGRNFNIQKGQLANQGRQIDDQGMMGMYGLGSQYSQSGLQSRMNIDQARAAENARVQAARSAQQRYNNAQDQEKDGRLLSTAGSVMPMVGGMVSKVIPGMGSVTGGDIGGGQTVGGASMKNPFGGHEGGKGYNNALKGEVEGAGFPGSGK